MFEQLLYFLMRLWHRGSVKTKPQVPILDDFDATRYLGKWYEIKRLDHLFERGVSSACAEYTALTGGRFLVTNTGVKKGRKQRFIATAKPTDIKNFYKIAPKAFPFFQADYRVAWVDADYQYAIVCSTSFDYLWLLSRQLYIPADVMAQMLDICRQLGFDTERLIDGQVGA